MADEAVLQDKTYSKKCSLVNSASSDKVRTQHESRNTEALFPPYYTALSEGEEARSPLDMAVK